MKRNKLDYSNRNRLHSTFQREDAALVENDDDKTVSGKSLVDYKKAKKVKCSDCEYCVINELQYLNFFDDDDFNQCHCEFNPQKTFFKFRKLICKQYKKKQ